MLLVVTEKVQVCASLLCSCCCFCFQLPAFPGHAIAIYWLLVCLCYWPWLGDHVRSLLGHLPLSELPSELRSYFYYQSCVWLSQLHWAETVKHLISLKYSPPADGRRMKTGSLTVAYCINGTPEHIAKCQHWSFHLAQMHCRGEETRPSQCLLELSNVSQKQFFILRCELRVNTIWKKCCVWKFLKDWADPIFNSVGTVYI